MSQPNEEVVRQHEMRTAQILEAMKTPRPKVESFVGMIYGPSGGGKTVLAAAIGKALNKPDEKTLIVDTSRGYVSLGNHGTLRDSVVTLAYQDLDWLETLSILLERKHPEFANIRTVVFDEISKMVRMDTNLHVAARGDDVPEWPDYNRSLNRIRVPLYRVMKRSDLNIIMLAHERDKKNKLGAVVQTHPDFIPSVVKEVKEDIHVVARMTAVAVPQPGGDPIYQRLIQALPTGSIDAKSRMPVRQLQMTPEEFVADIKAWIDSGGELVEQGRDIPADVDILSAEVPQEFRAAFSDEEVAPNDAGPVWSASS